MMGRVSRQVMWRGKQVALTLILLLGVGTTSGRHPLQVGVIATRARRAVERV